MMPVEFHFECVDMVKGWCHRHCAAGCAMDCQRITCEFCRHKDVDPYKEPCITCYVGLQK